MPCGSGILGAAGGVNGGAEEVEGLDAAAEGDGVAGVGAEVDDGGEAAAGEHVAQAGVEGGGGLVGGEGPARLGEVDVGVPEAGGDGAGVAGEELCLGGDSDRGADGGDAAVADEDGGVVERWVVG